MGGLYSTSAPIHTAPSWGFGGIPYRRASEVEGEIPAYAGMTFGFAGMT